MHHEETPGEAYLTMRNQATWPTNAWWMASSTLIPIELQLRSAGESGPEVRTIVKGPVRRVIKYQPTPPP